MTLALPNPMIIKPEDFEPPLKRKEPTVPGYWTVEEIAQELGVSTRKVLYDITGNVKLRIHPKFKRAYKLGPYYLIHENEALEYLWSQDKSKKSS
jgi:transcriptional antiterminator